MEPMSQKPELAGTTDLAETPAEPEQIQHPRPFPDDKGAAARPRSVVGWWVVAVFLALLLLVVLRAYLGIEEMFREVVSLPGQITEEWQRRFSQPTPTVLVLPPALEQVRSMARLQTVSFFLSTVVEVERPPSGWPWTGQRLLLVAEGKVIAGVDLSLLEEAHVQVIGRRVVVHLPEPEVFEVFLDEENTYVYDFEKGVFARYDASLESQARQRAVDEFHRSALEHGILEQARRQAEWEVQRLLLLLGYESVDFR